MRKPALMLVLCCLLWGYSFPVMQLAMESLRVHVALGSDNAAPPDQVQDLGLRAVFLGWRFGFAALLTALLFRSARSGIKRDEVVSGAILGVLFALGMICQLAGLRYILSSASSFLTSLTVVFTPVAQALIFKRRVGAVTWLGVALALAGAAVLSQANPGACPECHALPAPPVPYLGEAFTVLGAVFFTALVLGLDKLGSRCDPSRMSLAMFCSSALVTSVAGAACCGSAVYRASVLGPLIRDGYFVALLMTLTFFSSVLAIQLMYRYQKYVSPAVASVIYATESVFATIAALLFGIETLTRQTVFGGALILSAFLLVTFPRKERESEVPPALTPE